MASDKKAKASPSPRKSLTHADLINAVPQGPEWAIDWNLIFSCIPQWCEQMSVTGQEPEYHAEGDVLTHTKMVVQSLVDDEDWRAYSDPDKSVSPLIGVDPFGLSYTERQAMLFWSAVLHDIGKIECTLTDDDGRITSKGHSRIGTHMARRFLWSVGSPFSWREALCGIIMHHQSPFWLIEREDPHRMAIEMSFKCNTSDLLLHARADALGRICNDQENLLDNIKLTQELMREASCLGHARSFDNAQSRIEYLSKPDRDPSYAAHENFKSKVIMMSGLPGAGKDTWIDKNHPDLPVVGLDEIRKELNIKPTANQGLVVQTARERAREHLRRGEDFIWNGTNITLNLRGALLALFREYSAHTTIAYIEVDPKTHREQNKSRKEAVPDKVLDKLVRKVEPPTLTEAHAVAIYTSGEKL